MHARGMYIILDNTMATMGDLVGFEGYLNQSTPFSFGEHNAVWKTDRRYHDYVFNNTELDVCPWKYPRFWDDSGHQYNDSNTAQMVSCRDSEFDQVSAVLRTSFERFLANSLWSSMEKVRNCGPALLEIIFFDD